MIKKIRMLVILALCFVLVMGVTLSQFRSDASGSDMIYVAPFAVDAIGDSVDNLTVDCSGTNHNAVYEFTVVNAYDGVASGVSLSYAVELVLSEELPDGITVKIDGLSGEKSADGLSYHFSSDDWYFDVDDVESHDHGLVFTADSSLLTADVLISNISINIIAEQAD